MPDIRLHHLPLRLVTGAFILETGISKWQAPDELAQRLHGFATGTYPFLKRIPPGRFAKILAGSEIGLGTALLLPFVPAGSAGAALTAFSGALLGLYLKTPGMRQPRSLRPTQQGTPLAKDVWMAGIGAALIIDSLARGPEPKKQASAK